MSKTYKFCQSCNMPMRQDPEGGGTERDGSKSPRYCSYCYADGAFLRPDIDTPQKMQDFSRAQMQKKGVGRIVSWLFTRNIPNLERWKKKV